MNANTQRVFGVRTARPRGSAAGIRAMAVPRRASWVWVWLVLSVISAPAAALRLGTVRGFPGVTVEVPLSLGYATNEPRNVVAFQADVVLEAGSANFTELTRGAALRTHALASSAPAVNKRRVLVYSQSSEVLTNGVVAGLRFSVPPGSLQNVRLGLTNVILATSAGVSVPVTNTAGGIAILPVFPWADGHVDGFLTVGTNAGAEACYVVQATTDFVEWITVSTNNASGAVLQFSDAGAGAHPHRFYRAVRCAAEDGAALASLRRRNDGLIEMQVLRAVGLNFRIQASTNLVTWTDVLTVNDGSGPAVFIDAASTNFAHRFYRIRGLP